MAIQEGKSRPGPTVEEHVKVHALARLMLQGFIDNIQVSWVKLGREMSQRCLQAGANDYSGTLMEENISRLAGATAGEYLPPAEYYRGDPVARQAERRTKLEQGRQKRRWINQERLQPAA